MHAIQLEALLAVKKALDTEVLRHGGIRGPSEESVFVVALDA